MEKPKIGIYPGPDKSPTLMMKIIAEAIGGDADVVHLPGHGEAHENILERIQDLRGAAMLLFALSHDHSQEQKHSEPQIRLVRELKRRRSKIQMVCIEDVPATALQYDAMKEIAPHAAMLPAKTGQQGPGAFMEPTAAHYRAFGWKNVLQASFPPHWKTMVESIRRGQFRRRSTRYSLLTNIHGQNTGKRSLEPGTPVVSIIGYKRPQTEAELIEGTRRSLGELYESDFILHYACDRREEKIYKPSDLKPWNARREAALEGVRELAEPLNVEEIMGASDICFTHPGSSALNVVGPLRLHQVVPVMSYLQELESDTHYDYRGLAESHARVIEVAQDVRHTIPYVMSERGASAIRGKQEQNYAPIPDNWNPGKEVWETVRKLL